MLTEESDPEGEYTLVFDANARDPERFNYGFGSAHFILGSGNATQDIPSPFHQNQIVSILPDEPITFWQLFEGGEPVVERPLLFGGSEVRIESFTADPPVLTVETAEGLRGYLRGDPGALLTEDLGIDGLSSAYPVGGAVRVNREAGVFLRIAPHSEAQQLQPLPVGTQATITRFDVNGDWLYLRLENGMEGWARWYFNGNIWIEPDV
jgi:hypothetical protein